MKHLLSVFIGLGLGAGLWFGTVTLFSPPQNAGELDAQQLGADNFRVVSGRQYRLSGAGVTSSATSVTVASLTKPVSGNRFVMADDFGTKGYATIEPQNADRKEFISFTGISYAGDGKASLTGVTRGLEFNYPYTASSTLQKSHSGGSTLIFSNPPQLYDELAAKRNDELVTGAWTFSSTTPPGYDLVPANHNTGAIISTTSEFASMAALQAVVASGCLDASESNQGCVQIATSHEVASSTATGTEAVLVIPAKSATSTWNTATAKWKIPVSNAVGKISQLWLDLSEAFAWTGAHTFSSDVTFATTTHSKTSINLGESILLVASTTITGQSTPQPVFVSTTTNALLLSDANDNMASQFLGFAITGAANGATTTVQTTGLVTGFTGLTRGSEYYVSDTAGAISATAGTNAIKVGRAISPTELIIERDSNWVYVGSGSCSLGSFGSTAANCDIPGPTIARYAVVAMGTSNSSCSGSRGAEAYVVVPVAKNGATSLTSVAAVMCTSSGGNSTQMPKFTATFTSTSSVRVSGVDSGAAVTWNSATQNAYFYR